MKINRIANIIGIRITRINAFIAKINDVNINYSEIGILYFFLNRSILPSASTNFDFPVK